MTWRESFRADHHHQAQQRHLSSLESFFECGSKHQKQGLIHRRKFSSSYLHR
ncbi:hypothetical protein LINPERPRIM_LOCUS22443 [Linum perenne]